MDAGGSIYTASNEGPYSKGMQREQSGRPKRSAGRPARLADGAEVSSDHELSVSLLLTGPAVRSLRRLPPPNPRSCRMNYESHQWMQETHMVGHPRNRQHSAKVPQESELPGGVIVAARSVGDLQTPWRMPLGASTAC